MMHYPDFENRRVLVLGDVILDEYYWGRVDRISPEAPVPVLRVKQKTNALGGAGNVVLNLSGLGCLAVLVGITGDDMQGDLLADMVRKQGIEAHLIKSPIHPTTCKTRIIGQGQQLLRIDDEETWPITSQVREHLVEIATRKLTQVDAVILSDYGKGVLSGGLCGQVIESCHRKGLPVFVDPKGRDWQRYRNAFCITPNLKEFGLVAPAMPDQNGEMASAAAQLLQQYELNHLLVTRGPQGMTLFSRRLSDLHICAEAREVFDVSGAGDTVVAALAACVASGLSMDEAARVANLAAGVVVGKLGTHPIDASELKTAMRLQNPLASGKICSAAQAANIISNWKSNGKRVVFTNGCFDLLHVGHIQLLEQAADKGDHLVIGLNSDDSVRRLKGPSRPIIPEDQRAALLTSLKSVDLVVLFGEDTPLALIQSLMPDIIVKGGDYAVEGVVGHDIVRRWGGAVEIVPLRQGVSTSHLIKAVKAR